MSYFDPTADQSPEDIARYYRAAQRGMPGAFRQTHGGVEIIVTEIRLIDLAADRVTLAKWPRWGGSAFFISTGKNCRSPTGQSRLVIPPQGFMTEEEAHRRRHEEEMKRFAEFWREYEEAMRKQQAEAIEARMRRQLPGRWIKARCLEPECGHQAVVEVASLRFSPVLPAEAVISKLHCSKCGSKQIEASWSDTR